MILAGFFEKEYGAALRDAVADDVRVSSLLDVFVSAQGQACAETRLKEYLDEAFEAAVREQDEFVRPAMRSAREKYYGAEGLMLLADFLDAGVGLFDVPIEMSALSPAAQSSFQAEWRRFTRMYTRDPAGGKACVEAALR